MSTRGRRARGRPPKTTLISSRNKANFLRKPTAYQTPGGTSSDPNSRSSTPVSGHGTPTRGNGRGRSREAAQKGREFIHHLFDEDDSASRSSIGDVDADESSDVLDDIEALDNSRDSDTDYDDSDSNDSDDSYSTLGNVLFEKYKYKMVPYPHALRDTN